MKSNKLKLYIRDELKYIAIANSFVNSLNIPVNLFVASLLSDVITNATEGNVQVVMLKATILLTIVLGKSLFNIFVGITIDKHTLNKLHCCKLKLYNQLFLNPFYVLYSLNYGETNEKINDDFNTVTDKYISKYPNFIVGLLSFAVYFTYLFIQNRIIALLLFVISLLQIIPPLVIERYLQVNYDNCRDIEAKITDFTVEGYRGFLTIKLYGLKKWRQEKLAKYHKEYLKIGNKSVFTGTAESTLNDLISNILNYGTYGIIGLLILNNYSSLDAGIQAIALSGSFFGTVKISFDLIKNLAISRTAEVRLYKLFASNEDVGLLIDSGDVAISELSYSYGEKKILSDLTLFFDGSQITVIHGENGSGKSTLFRLITGLLKSQYGNITVGGIDKKELSGMNFPEKIFFLPQDDAEFDFSSDELYEMIIPQKKKEAIQLAQKFNLTKTLLYKSKIKELSGGERKKVFLSLAFGYKIHFNSNYIYIFTL